MPTRSTAVVPVATLLLLAGCGGAKDAAPKADSAAPAAATASSAAPSMVNITATDYAFEAPDTISGGMVSLRLVNKGKELHHVQVVRLVDGKTYADMMAFLKDMKPGTPPPTWVQTVGGPNSPAPGSDVAQVVTQELSAGTYALICVIPSPDGVPHIMKGMSKPLTVVPSNGPAAAAPTADVTVSMNDYNWDVTSGPITAGKHVIRLENTAAQDHELYVVKLEPGKTAGDFVKWVEKPDGPPPAMPVGGSAGMPKGVTSYVALEFTPGEYAMLCFIPDAKDGKPHVAHGMMKQFTVN